MLPLMLLLVCGVTAPQSGSLWDAVSGLIERLPADTLEPLHMIRGLDIDADPLVVFSGDLVDLAKARRLLKQTPWLVPGLQTALERRGPCVTTLAESSKPARRFLDLADTVVLAGTVAAFDKKPERAVELLELAAQLTHRISLCKGLPVKAVAAASENLERNIDVARWLHAGQKIETPPFEQFLQRAINLAPGRDSLQAAAVGEEVKIGYDMLDVGREFAAEPNAALVFDAKDTDLLLKECSASLNQLLDSHFDVIAPRLRVKTASFDPRESPRLQAFVERYEGGAAQMMAGITAKDLRLLKGQTNVVGRYLLAALFENLGLDADKALKSGAAVRDKYHRGLEDTPVMHAKPEPGPISP